jgi:hypothetical protein
MNEFVEYLKILVANIATKVEKNVVDGLKKIELYLFPNNSIGYHEIHD